MELAAALKLRYDLRFCEVAPTDPASSLLDARHRPARGGRNGALAAQRRTGDHRHRHRPHDARGRRPAAGDGMPAAQVRRAGRHRQDRWIGVVLRRHHPRLRHGSRAALSDAASGHRALGRGARAVDGPAPRCAACSRWSSAPTSASSASARSATASAIVQDGIITRQEAEALRAAGAVGEITGWAFDSHGPADRGVDQRPGRQRAAAPGDQAAGDRRRDGRDAPRRDCAARWPGRLISGLVTDEATAEHLLRALSGYAYEIR